METSNSLDLLQALYCLRCISRIILAFFFFQSSSLSAEDWDSLEDLVFRLTGQVCHLYLHFLRGVFKCFILLNLILPQILHMLMSAKQTSHVMHFEESTQS